MQSTTLEHPITLRLEHANTLIRQAGELAMHYYQAPHRLHTTHKGVQDLVTEADRAVEALLIKALSAAFPHDSFLGEEGGWQGQGNTVWVIDPIDGTANFARNLPNWCISIGLVVDGQIELGLIYQPVTDELFTARRGAGAFCNGRKMQVSSKCFPHESRINLGFSFRTPHEEHLLALDRLLTAHCEYSRTGSAALGLAHVADGRFEGYWEGHLNAWDAVAGLCLVQEAGGLTCDFLQKNGLRHGNPILACTPLLAHFLNDTLGSIHGCRVQ